jgi:hypothetical protein
VFFDLSAFVGCYVFYSKVEKPFLYSGRSFYVLECMYLILFLMNIDIGGLFLYFHQVEDLVKDNVVRLGFTVTTSYRLASGVGWALKYLEGFLLILFTGGMIGSIWMVLTLLF